jgi:serine/threonine protein kinase
MDSTRSSRLEQLFLGAKVLSGRERQDYLEQQCKGDAGLMAEVTQILEFFEPDSTISLAPDLHDVVRSLSASLGPHHSEAPGECIGPYRILEQLGEGGFGMVYRAVQERPIRREVALKVIKLGMDTRQVIARFDAERQTLALMDHPGIARVFEAGATNTGRPYFAMELIHGQSITEYCDLNELTVRNRIELFLRICKAMKHAHAKGIIHRDLKPSNIIVTMHDGKPLPKVIDFGISKATNQRLTEKTLFTQAGQFIGTPQYMSPEQAEAGIDVDNRTDLYSMGVLLYELLTGTTPITFDTVRKMGYGEIQRIVREHEPQRLPARLRSMGPLAVKETARLCGTTADGLRKQLRGDIDWILQKLLEKDPTRRYAHAGDLGSDIRRYLSDAPIKARPPSVTYRLRKALLRNNVAAASLAVIGTLIVLAQVWAISFFSSMTTDHLVVKGAILDVQFQAADAHLWVEEHLTRVAGQPASTTVDTNLSVEPIEKETPGETFNTQMADLANARRTVQRLMTGVGPRDQSVDLSTFSFSLVDRLRKLEKGLSEFIAIAQQRVQQVDDAQEGSELDDDFDRVYQNIKQESASLVHNVELIEANPIIRVALVAIPLNVSLLALGAFFLLVLSRRTR